MFEDARRCLQMGFDAIKHRCLNTYHPVLMWLPKKSLMRKQYRRMLGSGPEVLAGLRESWGPVEHVVYHPDCVFSAAFSNDGTRVESGSGDNTVRIWNSTTGEMERIPEGHSHWVRSVAFSSDGTHVVSGSRDKLVLIWNGNTGEIEHVLEGHSDSMTSVAISDDGTRVVSGSVDKTVRIWNANTRSGFLKDIQIMSRLLQSHVTGHAWFLDQWTEQSVFGMRIQGRWSGFLRDIQIVAFSPDGTHVVSGSRNGSVLVWDAITGESVSLPHPESFQFPDESNVTHILPGMFQLFAPGQQVVTLSLDNRWILPDRPSEGCWIPSEFRDIVIHAISGSKMSLRCRSGRVVIVDLMPPH